MINFELKNLMYIEIGTRGLYLEIGDGIVNQFEFLITWLVLAMILLAILIIKGIKEKK